MRISTYLTICEQCIQVSYNTDCSCSLENTDWTHSFPDLQRMFCKLHVPYNHWSHTMAPSHCISEKLYISLHLSNLDRQNYVCASWERHQKMTIYISFLWSQVYNQNIKISLVPHTISWFLMSVQYFGTQQHIPATRVNILTSTLPTDLSWQLWWPPNISSEPPSNQNFHW